MTRFKLISDGIPPFFFAGCFQLVVTFGCFALKRTFSSCHKLSMRLMSGDCNGHSRTLTFGLYIQPFITTLALCQVGRCWNHHIRPSPSFFVSFFKFSSKISLQFSFLKIPSIRWSVPATYVEKQPHNVIDPPPCSTVVCRTAGLSLFFI